MWPMVSRSDFQPPAEQGEPVPHQPDLVDFEPGPVAVGKHDIAYRRVGGQDAVADRADRDAGRIRGQRLRKQIGEDAPITHRPPGPGGRRARSATISAARPVMGTRRRISESLSDAYIEGDTPGARALFERKGEVGPDQPDRRVITQTRTPTAL